jgi:hypothetical protein
VEASSVAIERIVIDGNTVDRLAEGTSPAGTGITLKGTASFAVTRSRITNNNVVMDPAAGAGGICIETFGGVSRCRISDNDTSGGGMGISLDTTTYSVCVGNTVYNANSVGIEGASINNVTISGNTVDGNANTANGIELSNTTPGRNTIVGNNVSACTSSCIKANDADYSTITGNMVYATAGNAIELINCTHFVVSGNTLYGAGTGKKGVLLNTSSNVTITGNSLFNFTENGILLYANSSFTFNYVEIYANILNTCNVPLGTDLTGGAALGMLVQAIGNPGTSTARITDIYDWKNQVYVTSGTGSPESVVSASPGSVYYREDGGTSTSFYVKETGTSNTGWVAK